MIEEQTTQVLDISKSLLDKFKKLEIEGTKKRYKFDGEYIPSVTEVISAMLHEEGLMSWANSLGFRRIGYRAYMKDVAGKGTYAHLAVQNFLEKGLEPDFTGMLTPNIETQQVVYNTFGGFKLWWNTLNESHHVEIIYSEKKLTTAYFGGTCDCLLKVDGEYWLIDFKTSSRVRYEHTLQLSAYRYLLKEIDNIDVARCIVLTLNKEAPNYTAYELDLSLPEAKEYIEYCTQCFFSLLISFKLRMYTETKFETIFNTTEVK